jgi:hypothetical protein
MIRSASAVGRASDGDRLLNDLTGTLGAALDEAGEAAVVVCVSGLDHLTAAPFIASGRAIAAPGGLRWLADIRAASQRPLAEAVRMGGDVASDA